jgi:hypothetical protein
MFRCCIGGIRLKKRPSRWATPKAPNAPPCLRVCPPLRLPRPPFSVNSTYVWMLCCAWVMRCRLQRQGALSEGLFLVRTPGFRWVWRLLATTCFPRQPRIPHPHSPLDPPSRARLEKNVWWVRVVCEGPPRKLFCPPTRVVRRLNAPFPRPLPLLFSRDIQRPPI